MISRLALALAISALALVAKASTFECEGKKDLTKGEVTKILLANPKAQCFKTDAIILDERKMTLKNAPKD